MGGERRAGGADSYTRAMSGETVSANAPMRPLRVIGLIVAVPALAGLGFRYGVQEQVIPKNFGVVAEGKVYRSGELTPSATRRVVEERRVKTIVDLGAYDKDEIGERVAQKTAEALGVERHVYRLEGDGRGNPNAYVAALRIMTDPEKQPVLVHCSAGSERTGACVIFYRAIVEGKEVASVMHEAYEHRHEPKRNPHLAPVVKEWLEPIARALAQGGWIDGQPNPEHLELGTKGRRPPSEAAMTPVHHGAKAP